MADSYTHLHVHSHYSFLDGASSPEALARRAVELGQAALALTDWHGLYGAVAFDAAGRAVGVRPIFGAEVALEGGGHLTLLARDAAGWRSLCRLLTRAQLEGRKGHAPVRPALLAEHAAGLLCLSGCRHGPLAAPLLRDPDGGEEVTRERAHWLREVFGDDLWIELPRHELPDDRLLTRRLAALATRRGAGGPGGDGGGAADAPPGAADRQGRRLRHAGGRDGTRQPRLRPRGLPPLPGGATHRTARPRHRAGATAGHGGQRAGDGRGGLVAGADDGGPPLDHVG